METKENDLQDFNLINDFDLSNENEVVANDGSVEVSGLGSVGEHKYTYNDVCNDFK